MLVDVGRELWRLSSQSSCSKMGQLREDGLGSCPVMSYVSPTWSSAEPPRSILLLYLS